MSFTAVGTPANGRGSPAGPPRPPPGARSASMETKQFSRSWSSSARDSAASASSREEHLALADEAGLLEGRLRQRVAQAGTSSARSVDTRSRASSMPSRSSSSPARST